VGHEDILATFDRLYDEACVRRDADAAVALWAGDEDVTMWGSDLDERAHGPEAVAGLVRAIAAGKSRLRFRWDEQHVRAEGDVAWVNAAGAVTVDGSEVPYRTTGVLVRRDGGWRWHTHHGSVPDA
jgi:ketosteroid isomerase-like protein